MNLRAIGGLAGIAAAGAPSKAEAAKDEEEQAAAK
jgi:hypothetical protein